MNSGENTSFANITIIFLLYLLAFAIGVQIFVSDFLTGLMGYSMSPSAKLFVMTAFSIALLLQILPLLLVMTDTTNRPAWEWSRRGIKRWLIGHIDMRMAIVVSCLLFDALYDATYRTSEAVTVAEWIGSLFESIVLFTLGSEVLLVFAFRGVVSRGAAGIAQFREVWREAVTSAQSQVNQAQGGDVGQSTGTPYQRGRDATAFESLYSDDDDDFKYPQGAVRQVAQKGSLQ